MILIYTMTAKVLTKAVLPRIMITNPKKIRILTMRVFWKGRRSKKEPNLCLSTAFIANAVLASIKEVLIHRHQYLKSKHAREFRCTCHCITLLLRIIPKLFQFSFRTFPLFLGLRHNSTCFTRCRSTNSGLHCLLFD